MRYEDEDTTMYLYLLILLYILRSPEIFSIIKRLRKKKKIEEIVKNQRQTHTQNA